MKITQTEIPELVVVDVELHQDTRGVFIEQFQSKKLEELGFQTPFEIKQINFVQNFKKGVLRGFHLEPWHKYVSVIKGKAFGVWVDLRRADDRKIFTCELVPGRAVFVPKGVANSYQVLEDDTYYAYAVSDTWQAGEKYLAFNPFDRELDIKWPISQSDSVLSEKDLALPRLGEIL